LREVPHFETFCSVTDLVDLVERLRADSSFEVQVAGTSAGGVPVHHVRFGKGSAKAMLVGGVHAMEPIGGLTVFSLMMLLAQRNRALLEVDVEWHIVPCIDPDGARLNEGWSQQPFSLERFMRHYYQQAYRDQADMSFPVTYKNLKWDQPSPEAQVLQRLLDAVQPDFYMPLHNGRTGGASYFISQDLGGATYEKLYELLRQHRFPLQKRPIWKDVYSPYSTGVMPAPTVERYYDYLEQTTSSPEKRIPAGWGAFSHEYLAKIKPDALTFIAEFGYGEHPADQSERLTGDNLRRFKLEVEAESKFLGTMLLEEWSRVKEELDPGNPFYRAVLGGTVFPDKEKLPEAGFPLSRYSTQDTLFNPLHDRPMTEGDRFDVCMVDGGFNFLHMSYQFVRLLKESPQTAAVSRALRKLEPIYVEALSRIDGHVDLAAFKAFDCDTLARVQLGSALIAIEAMCGC